MPGSEERTDLIRIERVEIGLLKCRRIDGRRARGVPAISEYVRGLHQRLVIGHLDGQLHALAVKPGLQSCKDAGNTKEGSGVHPSPRHPAI